MPEFASPDRIARYLATTPSDRESAYEDVDLTAEMTPSERWACLAELLARVRALRGGRPPETDEDEPAFWRYWSDPTFADRH